VTISPTLELIDEIRHGRMVVLADAEDRENEGDLVLAADFVTPEAINFMATHGRGLICLTLTEERCRQLGISLMVSDNRSPMGTAFTTSIEAATGVSTGISAADRARTVRAATARHAKPEDIVQPGHIFPIKAQNGGVLVRGRNTGRLRPAPRSRWPHACRGHLRDQESRRLHGACPSSSSSRPSTASRSAPSPT
jgi:3,4-dihydroxy 2-butanone 4-phosphate synthase/GTP cyclohydrolase II